VIPHQTRKRRKTTTFQELCKNPEGRPFLICRKVHKKPGCTTVVSKHSDIGLGLEVVGKNSCTPICIYVKTTIVSHIEFGYNLHSAAFQMCIF
jgi:hypothetical protein